MASIINRRGCLDAAAGAAALVVMLVAPPGPALAQYPERGLTLIVPYGAGGGTDITARLLAKDLEPALGKPVTVENRAGGGGWVGWGALAAAPPDGYTIGYLNVPSMYAGYLDRQYNRKETLESFTPLMNHVIDYNVWAVKADSPFKPSGRDRGREAEARRISIAAYGAGSDDTSRSWPCNRRPAPGSPFRITQHSRAKAQALGGHVDVLGANVSEVAEK